MPIRATVLATVLAAMPATALAQDVAGTWDVTWAQAVRVNRDGTIEVQKWGEAALVLRTAGDSLAGTWTAHIIGTVTWKVTGRRDGSRLRLVARENDGSDPELAQVERMEWTGTIDGDRIEGLMHLVFRGGRASPNSPWRATRRDGAPIGRAPPGSPTHQSWPYGCISPRVSEERGGS